MMITPIAVAFVFIAALASAQNTKIIPTPADVAEAPADAEKTASGLASKVIEAGTGKTHPARTDRVTVDYSGWTTDGKMFDSSLPTGKAATFPLDKVIAGWTEGVQLMVAGETRRFWIPESLAYKGKEGRPKRHARIRRKVDFVHRAAVANSNRLQDAPLSRQAHSKRP